MNELMPGLGAGTLIQTLSSETPLTVSGASQAAGLQKTQLSASSLTPMHTYAADNPQLLSRVQQQQQQQTDCCPVSTPYTLAVCAHRSDTCSADQHSLSNQNQQKRFKQTIKQSPTSWCEPEHCQLWLRQCLHNMFSIDPCCIAYRSMRSIYGRWE